jgi:hypothetical protein
VQEVQVVTTTRRARSSRTDRGSSICDETTRYLALSLAHSSRLIAFPNFL